MKKVLISLLVIVIAIGLLGAAGYAGYRYGFTQGMITASSNGADGQSVGPRFGMTPRGMPMHEFGFQRGFDRDGIGMIGRTGFGFRIFPLFGLLVWLLFLGLIAAAIYWLVARSGWRLTRTSPAATTTTTTTAVEPPPPASTGENNHSDSP